MALAGAYKNAMAGLVKDVAQAKVVKRDVNLGSPQSIIINKETCPIMLPGGVSE